MAYGFIKGFVSFIGFFHPLQLAEMPAVQIKKNFEVLQSLTRDNIFFLSFTQNY
mgnify:CR=1 FL=1